MDCALSTGVYHKMIKITKIWIFLVVLTLFAFLLGFFDLISYSSVAILLITTFIKGQLVIDYFMGLEKIQLKYRIIPVVWLVTVLFLIATAYYYPVDV